MGIYINLEISKSVTQSEWDKVYAETLLLVKEFPFADRRTVNIHSVETICMVKTKEQEDLYYGMRGKETWVGWTVSGNYDDLTTAEDYSLPKYLSAEDYDPEAGDAIWGQVPIYLNYDWQDTRFDGVRSMWGNKTQGESYHIYLLAIACLIQARLGEKAYIYGDITRGQCKRAVEMANWYLKTPIEMPDQCNLDRLYQRLSKLDLPDHEKIILFGELYLGTKDAEYGEFLRSSFSEEALDNHWKDRFESCNVNSLGFNHIIYEYLLLGNSLEQLCHYVDFKTDDDYKKFVNRIMDSKLHLKEKNCEDVLKLDQEEERPYSIYTLLAQFAFAGAENKKVDRFVPIEEIRTALKNNLPAKYPVNEWIDDYLETESHQQKIEITEDTSPIKLWEAVTQDPSEAINQVLNWKRGKIQETREEYDISEFDELKFYETYDRIHPVLEKSLIQSIQFLEQVIVLLKEKEYDRLMEKNAHARCEWMIEQNTCILIRDMDWDKIFTNIELNKDSFYRYYPIFRVELENEELIQMTIAFLINDDLYYHIKDLAAEQEEDI